MPAFWKYQQPPYDYPYYGFIWNEMIVVDIVEETERT